MTDLLHSFTLGDIAREHARSYPGQFAMVDGSVRHTWPEHDARIAQLASALSRGGIERGDVVLWTGQNSHRILECLGACARLGAVLCIVNWRQSADELAFVLDDADAKIVIWQEDEVGEIVRAARAAAGECGATWLRHDGEPDDPDGYEAFLATGSAEDTGGDSDHVVDPGDPVLMLYTAAFLGTPNGALLSHQAVLVQSLMMANLQRIDAGYSYLNSGPMFHVATLMTTLATYLMGGRSVFVPRPDAAEFCRVIEAERCTGAFLMGPTIDQILEHNANGAHDLTSLRTFRGTPEWNAMITVDESPWALRPAGFGQTEVMGMLTYNALGGDAQGSAGRPSPLAAVRIVDPDGNEVSAGETGEIVARGPQVMVGYRNRPEETRRRQAGGWHHTGDLGRREHDGSLSFVGPKGRLIKSAAENIYPAEVEAALASHPAVRETAVIGVPDPIWWQAVTAIVVLHDGKSVSDEELIEHVRSKIASYKKPKTVIIRAEPLPRLGWPIDYGSLDAQYGGGGYPGDA